MSNEAFEKVLSSYAAKHVTGSIGLVRKIGKHFYDVRQSAIDALETDNRHLSDSLEAIDLDAKALVDEMAALKEKQRLFEADNATLRAEIDALKAEVERLQKDAERYQWLRDPCVDIRPIIKYQRGDYGWGLMTHQMLDAAIDAAMKETK